MALICVAVAEAGGAPKLIVPFNLEISFLTLFTAVSFHILLAATVAIQGIAVRSVSAGFIREFLCSESTSPVSKTSLWKATTGLASGTIRTRELPEIRGALIAPFTSNARLAGTLSLQGALNI